jgi:hypothetical protein
MKKFFVIFCLFASPCFGQSWSGVIAPARATDWTQAGLPGDAPPDANWPQCGATIAAYGTSGSPASPSTINNATAGTGTGYTGCSTPHVIVLGSGDFYLNALITLQSNVALRGQGANNTRLHFPISVSGCNGVYAAICIAGSNTYEGGGYTKANWTAGYSKGTATITLDNVAGIVTNLTPIVLDQCNTGFAGNTSDGTCTGSAVDNSGLYVCEVTSNCSSQGANTGLHRINRAQEEIVVATAIRGSGPYSVTLNHAIYWPGWASGQSPQAWWGSSTITNAGVENLTIDDSTLGQRGVVIMTAYRCWAIGITTNKTNFYAVFNYITSHDLIANSYFYQTYNAGTESYGVGGGLSGDLLMENNIMQGITDPINFDSQCSGCVAGYNFAVNDYDTTSSYSFGMFSFHGAGESNILLEGNIGVSIDSDDIWGTHTLSTFFRNFMNGYEPNGGALPTDNNISNHLGAFSRYYNVVGNVFGNPLYHTIYSCLPSTTTGSASGASACPDGGYKAVHVLDSGWPSNTWGQTQGSVADPLTPATALFWANCDTATGTCRFCGNSSDTGWSSGCKGASASINSCTESGSTVTCSSSLNPGTNSAIGSSTGQLVNVSGVSVSSYNGSFPVTASSSTSFSYDDPYASGLGTGSGGTATIGSEIPTTDPNFANSVPTKGDTGAGQGVMPSSFYNGVTGVDASCGTGLAFWKNPTSGTCPPYPFAGPDVSGSPMLVCTSGTYKYSMVLSTSQCAGGTSQAANQGNWAYANPAMVCYLNQMSGTPDGTGNFNLNFNPSACYTLDAGTVGGGTQPPNPPTNLTTAIQ